MRDFGKRRWDGPDGPRVHVYALVSDPVRELVEKVYAPVLAGWSQVVRVVPSDRLHLTLAWLPAPVAAEVSQAQHRKLDAALHDRLLGSGGARVACGPALVTRHGVRLDVTPDHEVDALAHHVRDAMRDVFGASAVAEPTAGSCTPHIALAYGTADTPAEDDVVLAEQLREARVPQRMRGRGYRPTRAILDIRAVTVLETDTFAPDPWQWDQARTIGLRASWLVDPRDPQVIAHRTQVAFHDQVATEFLRDWQAEIDIVHGLDEPDDRPPTRIAPRLGPALTAVARHAHTLHRWQTHDRADHALDRLSGATLHTSPGEAAATRDGLQAGLRAHLPDLDTQQTVWLAVALTGDSYW